MAPGQDQQLEKLVDESLKSSDFQALDVFLQEDICEGATLKCSKQFLTKLDKLVNRGFDHKDAKPASLGLTILYKCGKNLSLSGVQGLSGIIAQGLVKKMVHWFEKCRQLWIQIGPQRDDALLNLAEDFFDSLMVVHQASKEGTYQITESLLYPIGQLAADPRIYIMIQKEAIRKLNIILDKIPVELKKGKKILSSQEASDVMIKLAGQILDGGDYDLQTALMEALCRMATPDQRTELAVRWFTMEYVASAFIKINDSEFETDCRKFLNLVNGMQGDSRRVYSYPCLEVFLDKHELLMPPDEKLEEFWIDFNLGSQSISFYFSLADEEAEEGQWDTICITANEVQSYTITGEGRRRVLRLKLSELVCVGVLEGSVLTIHFSSSLDILQAVHSVYGQSKSKSFVGKSSTSVVKTTVKIIMDDSSSQAIQESQVSPLTDNKREGNTDLCWLAAPPASLQLVTPAKRRISESTTFITSSTGGSVQGGSPFSVVMPANTPSRGKGKPALEMVCSCERHLNPRELKTTAKPCGHRATPSSTRQQTDTSLQSKGLKEADRNKAEKYRKCIPVEKAVEMVQAEQDDGQELLESSFVPDSQPTVRTDRSLFSRWNKLSVSEILMMPTQKHKFLSRPESRLSLEQLQECPSSAQTASGSGPISHKQLHAELTQRLQEVLHEMNQTPGPQELVGSQGRRSKDREGSRRKEPMDRRSTGRAAEEPQQQQQAGRRGVGRGKDKGQRSLEPDAALVKAPVKTIPTKVPRERTAPDLTSKASGTMSSKEKRNAEVAGSMVKLISSHYDSNGSTAKAPADNLPPLWVPPPVNRPIFDKSWSSKKEASKAAGFIKTYSKTGKGSTENREDSFAFKVDILQSTGGKGRKLIESSAIDSSGIHDSWTLPSTTKKGQPAAKGNRFVKKHLFSDTDTDCAVTEVSWLSNSSRRPKPKVTDYTRPAPTKTRAPTPDESPEFPLPSPKPVKEKTKSNKKRPWVKETAEQPERPVGAAASNRPTAAGRRPQRAAATTAKSYKEPDTDDSRSESEEPPAAKAEKHQQEKKGKTCQEAADVTKKKTASNMQPTTTYRKLDSDSQDSQSETEQPAAPKKCVMGQKSKSEKTCQEATDLMKKKTTSTKQPTKTYKDLDSDSQSESEQPPAPKKRSFVHKQKTEQSKKTTDLKNKKIVPAKAQMSVQKESWASRLSSFSPSPPPIEKMRFDERSAPTPALTRSPLLALLGSPLPASPVHPCRDYPPPILELPKPPRSSLGSTGGFRPSSFYSSERKPGISKTLSLPSLPPLSPRGQTPAQRAAKRPSVAELSPIPWALSTTPRSPLSQSSQPLMASTALELLKSSSVPSPTNVQLPQIPRDNAKYGFHFGSSKYSPVSRVSLSQSSTKSSVPAAPLALAKKLEKTPYSDRGQTHVSGPSHKHDISPALSSNSEEDDKEERKVKRRGQHSARMKPRKLFKSSTKAQAQSYGEHNSSGEEDETRASQSKDAAFKAAMKGYQNIKSKTVSKTTHDTVVEVSPEDKVSRVVSTSHTVSSSRWEAEVEDEDEVDEVDEDTELPDITVSTNNMGSVCRQLSSELQRKFQNRSRRMDLYTKQSLQTVQHHVSSLSGQVVKYRTQRLEQVRRVLTDEIENLEQDDATLNNMEKELTTYWKKQSKAFHSYREKGTRRLETLKSTFQNNMCHSLEYEETIYTSQMCLMRKDMKSAQDRLFQEMQKEEIQSVKRGLQALFLPEGTLF